MKKIVNISLIIFIILFQFKSFAEEKNYHKELITDWSRIFPDKNRNAAGPKFFKYIIDKKISYKDFIEFNKLYCAVSGSLIDPNSESEFLFIKESKTDKKTCGNYYRCCVPCSCDLMKYSEAQKMKYRFEDGGKTQCREQLENIGQTNWHSVQSQVRLFFSRRQPHLLWS